VEARIARIYQTSSGYQPHVEIHYSATRFEQPLGAPFSTTIVGNNVIIQAAPFTLSQFEDRLQLTQLVSDGGRTRQLVRADIASARAAMGDLVHAVRQLQYDVRTAFIAVLEAREQVDVARRSLATAEEHLRLSQAQYEAGTVARADITFSTTPVTRARITLHTAERSVDTRMAHLLAIIGADPAKPVAIAETVELPQAGPELADVRRDALIQRSDLSARADETTASAAAMDAAKRSRSVNVQASAGFREIGYQTREVVPQHPGWSAGLEFSYPVLDGGLISAQVREAQARMKGASEREEDLARRIDEEVVTAWLTLRDARERLDLANAVVKDAQESLDVARGQYLAGVGTNLQVLDAQVVLYRARADAVNSRYAVERALASLLLATGR
jgi:outer membrane protein TolC